MLNHIVLMGRLTRDPELRRTGSGIAVASFSLAVDRDFGSRETGEKETDFIDIVAWRNTAEFVSKYFTKGRMAVVSGRLQIRNWTDKEGNKRRSAEVVADNIYFGDSKRDTQADDAEINIAAGTLGDLLPASGPGLFVPGVLSAAAAAAAKACLPSSAACGEACRLSGRQRGGAGGGMADSGLALAGDGGADGRAACPGRRGLWTL